MIPYLARRLLVAVPTLLGITLVTFAFIHLAPGDPLGPLDPDTHHALSPEALSRMRAVYHLDEPIWKQYLLWLGGLARGDLGVSLHDGEPVARKIASRLPATLALALAATLIAWAVAIPTGVAAAARPGGPFDRGSGVLLFGLYSVPIFWGGLLLQLAFAVALRWLPLQGLESDGAAAWGPLARIADRGRHLLLPAVCLAYGQLAFLARFTRGSMIETMSKPYIRTARAKGLGERAVRYRHGLRNALLPLVTIAGFTLPALAGGAVIVERIFSWPGAGRLLFDSIQQRDLTTLMGLTTLAGILTLAGTLIADVFYALADPRIRYGRREDRA